jgi:hypothetical protein
VKGPSDLQEGRIFYGQQRFGEEVIITTNLWGLGVATAICISLISQPAFSPKYQCCSKTNLRVFHDVLVKNLMVRIPLKAQGRN